MPRVSTIDKKAVSMYCTEPRSISDICSKFNLGISQAHRAMSSLIRSNVIASRIMRSSGSQRKVFLLSSLENENAWGGNSPLINPLMAHDPFGRTKELALQLVERGISIENFAKQHTRSIRVLDIDPIRKSRNREELLA
jgi:hypothetical protein